MARLDGKVAIITGGARGQGEAEARLFAREGAKVVIGDVLDDTGKDVAADLGESAVYVHLDVSSEEDWADALAAAQALGPLSVLVNNAAILRPASIVDTSLADYRAVIDVNQVGCFLGMKAAVAPMQAAGGGSIINISSIDGLGSKNGLISYSASKFAIRGMTKTAALELGQYGIRVNSDSPGWREHGDGQPVRRRRHDRPGLRPAAHPEDRRADRDRLHGALPGLRRGVVLHRRRVRRRRRVDLR